MTTTINTDKFVFVDFSGGSGRVSADKIDGQLYSMHRYDYKYRRVVYREVVDDVMFNNYSDAKQYLRNIVLQTSSSQSSIATSGLDNRESERNGESERGSRCEVSRVPSTKGD